MQHDPVKAADTRAWLEKAFMDLRSASVDLGAAPPIVGVALFHCQQAVEKVIKALLTWDDRPFRKTHDLAELPSGMFYSDRWAELWGFTGCEHGSHSI